MLENSSWWFWGTKANSPETRVASFWLSETSLAGWYHHDPLRSSGYDPSWPYSEVLFALALVGRCENIEAFRRQGEPWENIQAEARRAGPGLAPAPGVLNLSGSNFKEGKKALSFFSTSKLCLLLLSWAWAMHHSTWLSSGNSFDQPCSAPSQLWFNLASFGHFSSAWWFPGSQDSSSNFLLYFLLGDPSPTPPSLLLTLLS